VPSPVACAFKHVRGYTESSPCHANICATDLFRLVIRVIQPHEVVVTVAGTGEPGYRDGPAATAQFIHPLWAALATDSSLYVADCGNNCIRRIPPPPQG
jgi:hypothetical protein